MEARAYCFRLTGNIDDGDDLYQESIVRAYGGFAGLKKTESFRPWLFRIIGNNFKSRFRKPWWKRVIAMSVNIDDCDWSENPSGQYDARRRLEFALEVLSAEDRMIVVLADLEGWKISELAAMMKKNEGMIKMRLIRARAKMRRRLGSLYRKKRPVILKGSL